MNRCHRDSRRAAIGDAAIGGGIDTYGMATDGISCTVIYAPAAVFDVGCRPAGSGDATADLITPGATTVEGLASAGRRGRNSYRIASSRRRRDCQEQQPQAC